MSSFLPISSKNYLLETLSSTESSRNIEFLEEIVNQSSEKLPKQTGGYGVGGAATTDSGEPDDNSHDTTNVLFGKQKPIKVGTDKYHLDLNSPEAAAGLYAVGKGANSLADVLDSTGAQRFGDLVGLDKFLPKNAGFLGDVVGKIATGAVSAVPGATSKLLRQVGDLSGANWFDANVGNIGQSQMQLAAQGAGKPWTPLVAPKQAANKVTPYDPTDKLNRNINAAEKADKINKLRKKGYNIP
jgi:hypothetical protein